MSLTATLTPPSAYLIMGWAATSRSATVRDFAHRILRNTQYEPRQGGEQWQGS